VHVDTTTDLPSFGTVKIGTPTSGGSPSCRSTPQATVGLAYLQFRYDRNRSKMRWQSAPTASYLRLTEPTKRRSSGTTACHARKCPAWQACVS
jgi:hypothetical protein